MNEFWILLAAAAALTLSLLLARVRAVHAERQAREADKRFNDTDHKGQDQSPQDICQRLASTLGANAIVVERLRAEIIVVAGFPWKAEVEPLDKIALDWSFTTGLPPKAGMGNPFSSDWLFLPVQAGGRVVAVLGVMARHGRRRFILDEQPAIRSAVAALERIYKFKDSRRPGLSDSWNVVSLTKAG